METDIKMIEIEDGIEEKYYQAIARLVDNPRFLTKINSLRGLLLTNLILRKDRKYDEYRIRDEPPVEIESLLIGFKYPQEFGYAIWRGIINKKITNDDIGDISSIDWGLEKKLSGRLKGSALKEYLSVVPFEKKIYRSFRRERKFYWLNKLENMGYLKIAKRYDSNKSSVQKDIERYKLKITF